LEKGDRLEEKNKETYCKREKEEDSQTEREKKQESEK